MDRIVRKTNMVMRSFGEPVRREEDSKPRVANEATVRTNANSLHHRHKPETVFDKLTVSARGDARGRPARRPAAAREARRKASPSVRKIQRMETSPAWLGRRLAHLLRGYQRAHLIGPGFGEKS